MWGGWAHASSRAATTTILAAWCLFGATTCFGGDGDAESSPTPTANTTATTATTVVPAPTPTVMWPEVTRARVTTQDLNVRTGPGIEHAVLGQLQPGDEIPVAGRARGLPWLGLPGIGWVAYVDDWLDLPVAFDALPSIPDPAATFELVGPLHTPGTSSGIPIVDEVVGAAVRGDRAALLALASVGEPPTLPADVPRACPDAILPASQLEAQLDRLLTSSVVAEPESANGSGLQLYAVVRAPAGESLEPEYVAVLAFERGEGRQIWISPDGEITRFGLGCGPTLPGEMLRVASDEPFFWFRPPLPPPLHPIQ